MSSDRSKDRIAVCLSSASFGKDLLHGSWMIVKAVTLKPKH